jgi:hypothetical protein
MKDYLFEVELLKKNQKLTLTTELIKTNLVVIMFMLWSGVSKKINY